MTYLVMRRGPEPGKIYRMEKDEVRLGRGSKNDIIIHDNDVYREHLLFAKTADGIELRDLTDERSTSVNGRVVVEPLLLQAECIIELGDAITLEYRLGEPQEEIATLEIAAPAITGESPQQAYLIVTLSSQPDPAIYPLQGSYIKVGRSQSNDIVLVEPEMSREHFNLTLTGSGGYMIADNGSTNGTMVNGQMLDTPALLHFGDTINIGTMVELQFTDTPEAVSAPRTPATRPMMDAPTLPSSATTALRPSDPAGERPTRPSGALPQYQPTLHDFVLVTYARDDWETVVAPMIVTLNEAQIHPWVDQFLLMGGEEWQTITEQARLECWALVVVVSPRAMRSELVRKNWRHFQNREKPIVLFIQEAVEIMPIGSNKLVRVNYDAIFPQIAFQRLANELKRIRAP